MVQTRINWRQRNGRWRLNRSLPILLMSVGAGLFSTRAMATTLFNEVVVLLTSPLDVVEVARLRSGDLPAGESIITEGTISQTGLTLPSLWWTVEQFGGQLLDYWVAYTGADNAEPRRVDLLVNQQMWVRFNYLERYAFLNQFGAAASDFGYSTRLFNWRGDLIGAYICEFAPGAIVGSSEQGHEQGQFENIIPTRCQTFLDATGRGALSGTSPDAPLPTNGGTDL
ncbi:hypothetical protein [Thermocoleostomius sinensis]|uniref:Uncharacterized protein n=1 Tax=Thermocoleostomius sinensis A174 TaxID=2016057 RepID=A0A9E8ZDR3_9CYAN|nr:hypothetical protein [Thermocoleostomius sinensis]WAL60921.1 hypothetical protein OXH18_02670 [Thermocoleostomius sinensis A174]